jgi:hypothetical protein
VSLLPTNISRTNKSAPAFCGRDRCDDYMLGADGFVTPTNKFMVLFIKPIDAHIFP